MKEYCVTIRQRITIGNRKRPDLVDRRFTVRSETADKAKQTVEDAGHAGRIVTVEEKREC